MTTLEQLRIEAVERFMVLDDSIKQDLNDIVSLVAQLWRGAYCSYKPYR